MTGKAVSVEDLKSIGKLNQYIIMPRYGINLSDFFVSQNMNLSKATVLDIGVKVLKQIKAVHRAGFIYNDLKPDNIMLENDSGDFERNFEERSNILEGKGLFLIDFGFCSQFKDQSTGKLHACHYLKKFRGNLRYASADQLDFKSTSRKDDLVSLCYMLVYLANKGKFLDTEC